MLMEKFKKAFFAGSPESETRRGGEEEKIPTPLRAQQKGRHAQGASMGGPTGMPWARYKTIPINHCSHCQAFR